MGIEPRFGRRSSLLHKIVVSRGDIRAVRARLEFLQGIFLGALDNFESLDQFLRCLSENDRSGQLRIKPAGTIVLDEQWEIVALADGPALKMPLSERGWLADFCGHPKENPLLAAQELALILRDGSYIEVPHPGLDLSEHSAEYSVLHLRSLFD